MSALVAPRAIAWRVATVAEVVEETAQAVTIVFDVPDWPGHVAGQHVDVRLTAEDGYQAERSYSIASGPEEGRLALTVERIDDGEVSPYLAGVLEAGDQIELRGPIGRHFSWRVEDGGPLLLVAGGSGLVPLMSMLRHRHARGSDVDARLLVSARTRADLLYRRELEGLAGGPGLAVHPTLTRERPDGWDGRLGRVDRAMLEAVGPAPEARPHVFVCGPTGFVEHVADALVDLGHDPGAIHAERFGPTGG
jgi:ferredoxin-NADP reductase